MNIYILPRSEVDAIDTLISISFVKLCPEVHHILFLMELQVMAKSQKVEPDSHLLVGFDLRRRRLRFQVEPRRIHSVCTVYLEVVELNPVVSRCVVWGVTRYFPLMKSTHWSSGDVIPGVSDSRNGVPKQYRREIEPFSIFILKNR